MSNELTTPRKPGTLEQLKAMVDERKDQLSLWAGTERRARQICDLAMLEIHKNAELMKCSPASLFYSVREAIANGLTIGGFRPMAYLVPFGGKVQLIPSYLGLTELVRRTGNLLRHMVEVVYEGDHFDFALGDNPHINHTPNDEPGRSQKKPTHVYAIFWMRDGAIHRSVWTTARIDAHKERYSKTWKHKDSAWQTAWDAMAKKTVIRDLVNRGILAIQERLFEGATSLMERDEPIQEMLPAIEQAPLSVTQQGLNVEVSPDPTATNDDLWNRYETSLIDASNLGTVTAVMDEFLPLFKSQDDKAMAEKMAEDAATKLRNEKTYRANV